MRRIFNVGFDFDMCINNWEGGGSPFLRVWDELFKGTVKYIPASKAKFWECSFNYPEDIRKKVRSIYVNPKPGFYTDMPLMPGAVDAIKEVKAMGHNAYIVTIPIMEKDHELEDFFENSILVRTLTWTRVVMEKKNYLLKHFGKDAPPLWPVEDKTLFAGDILIDDCPTVGNHGARRPTWQHILFDRGYAYNKDAGVGQMKGDWTYIPKKIDELSKIGAE